MEKTKEEIEKLEVASKIADECFIHVCNNIKTGMTEIEIAKMMDEYMLINGAEALAFDTIVGSGINSAQIHSTPTDKKLEKGDVVLLDFGCVYKGYCSDISRTIFINKISDEQRRIYEIVLEAHTRVARQTKDGMFCNEVDRIARDYIKEFGYDFAHALGHGVGTVVHDEPVISLKNDKDRVTNNMVFTIEPGIYLENKFGIRIEDTVILENDKVKSLNSASKDIIIV